MAAQDNRTGIVLPYEELAMRGRTMPDGLKSYDQTMYMKLRCLYKDAGRRIITAEEASNEKRKFLEAYRIDKFNSELGDFWAKKYRDLEAAVDAYRKDKTIENADRIVEVIYE